MTTPCTSINTCSFMDGVAPTRDRGSNLSHDDPWLSTDAQ